VAGAHGGHVNWIPWLVLDALQLERWNAQPRWLMQYVGGKLEFDTVQGHDFPEDLSPYTLAIHCGACVVNRREVLNRLLRCRQAGVPITNYGLVIAFSLGIFERALEPFPAALDIYREAHAARRR
jgi:hypothetical protein